MSEVIKYEEGDPCAGMYESSEGVWVHIDDYDQLKEKLAVATDCANAYSKMFEEVSEERERLRKQLDEARRLLREMNASGYDWHIQINAWLEGNKK